MAHVCKSLQIADKTGAADRTLTGCLPPAAAGARRSDRTTLAEEGMVVRRRRRLLGRGRAGRRLNGYQHDDGQPSQSRPTRRVVVGVVLLLLLLACRRLHAAARASATSRRPINQRRASGRGFLAAQQQRKACRSGLFSLHASLPPMLLQSLSPTSSPCFEAGAAGGGALLSRAGRRLPRAKSPARPSPPFGCPRGSGSV